MKRIYEKRTWNFRGEQFEYAHQAWLCEDTGEQFTDDASDTAGFVQVTNQYRVKYGIPFTDEVIAVRERYGVSAAKMSLILGIGVNQYRLYEQGEVPSVSNGRMIRSVMNPEVMLEMVESASHELTRSEYNKIMYKVKSVIANGESDKLERYEMKRVFSTLRGAENGYAQLSLGRLKNIMLYILERCGEVWYTKMNKLLFYIDFLSYRENGMAMTGLSYRAIDFGPVPERWDRVYSEFAEIRQEIRQVGDWVGNVLESSDQADVSLFSDSELQIMNTICNNFASTTSREISRLSHGEKAWIDYHETCERIPFEAAFTLKAV
ncbi:MULTISPECIES: type II toxin-antitoxin system antitoxin SocA domain-containing protein [Butyricimonas]|uniref:type II toxin-antitoxin system antitoxin SocA domain-containing protein n=1 Tax=Butyricimonas TaxID=574697 RepID=UPI001651E647|nr:MULTISPECIES: type II toxin-antitoxin system antitoxin SocA domain-containing protein [Butyricimonas]